MENLQGPPRKGNKNYNELRDGKPSELDKRKEEVGSNSSALEGTGGGAVVQRRSVDHAEHAQRTDLPERSEVMLFPLMESLGVPKDVLPNLQRHKTWKKLEENHPALSCHQTESGRRLDFKGKTDVPRDLVICLLKEDQWGPACTLLSECDCSERVEALETMLFLLGTGREVGVSLRYKLTADQNKVLRGLVLDTTQWLAMVGDHKRLEKLFEECNEGEQQIVVAHFMQEPLLHVVAIKLLKLLPEYLAKGAMKLAVRQARDGSYPKLDLLCLAKFCSQVDGSSLLKKKDRLQTSRLPELIRAACYRLLTDKKLSALDVAQIAKVMESRGPNVELRLDLPPEVLEAMSSPTPVTALLDLAELFKHLNPTVSGELESGIGQAIHMLCKTGQASEQDRQSILRALSKGAASGSQHDLVVKRLDEIEAEPLVVLDEPERPKDAKH